MVRSMHTDAFNHASRKAAADYRKHIWTSGMGAWATVRLGDRRPENLPGLWLWRRIRAEGNFGGAANFSSGFSCRTIRERSFSAIPAIPCCIFPILPASDATQRHDIDYRRS